MAVTPLSGAAAMLPVLHLTPTGRRPARPRPLRPASATTAATAAAPAQEQGQRHRVYVVSHREEEREAATGPCVVRLVMSPAGAAHQLHYRHDDEEDAESHEQRSARAWHEALHFLARAKEQWADVTITITHPPHHRHGEGFVVGVLSAHALTHGAGRKGLKHAVASMQTALREALLHQSRQQQLGPAAGPVAVAHPPAPSPRVMAWAGRALIVARWHERHVARIFGGEVDADEVDEEDPDSRARRFTVYVGDRFSAESRDFLAHAGITHVVNCGVAHGCENAFAHEPHMRYVTFDSDDCDPRAPYPGAQWDVVMPWMQEAKAQGAQVLVHCVAGINRSVTTLAIFMVLEGMADSVAEAVEMIQERRAVARPLVRYVDWGEAYVRQVRRFGFGAAAAASASAAPDAGARQRGGGGEEEEEKEDEMQVDVDEMQGRRYRKRRDKPKKR